MVTLLTRNWRVYLARLAAVLFGVLTFIWPRITLLTLVFAVFDLSRGRCAGNALVDWLLRRRPWHTIYRAGISPEKMETSGGTDPRVKGPENRRFARPVLMLTCLSDTTERKVSR